MAALLSVMQLPACLYEAALLGFGMTTRENVTRAGAADARRLPALLALMGTLPPALVTLLYVAANQVCVQSETNNCQMSIKYFCFIFPPKFKT